MDSLLESALSVDTKSSYQRSWDKFINFCNKFKLSSLMPLSTTIILQFIAYLNMQGTPYSSIASVLSAISYKHKSADFPDPCKVFKVTQIMTSIKKSSIVKEKKLPITLPLLNKMIDSVQQLGLSDYETTLYKSMFLLQFYFGLRIGEITDSQHNISLSEISIQTDHISLSFSTFKHSTGN